jgi:beta-galactosidase GanA
VDARDHTVVMMQVENEVGILGASRDHSPTADREFAGPVPAELMRHLESHRNALNQELRDLWEKNGAKSSGSWAEVFGDASDPTRADEIFMAWHYGRYVQRVAAIGKSAYPLPMYVNAWLGGDKDKPGNFPSGGPKPRVMDIWKAAGAAIDLYSPDLYSSDVAGWCALYHRPNNPLFIPETNGGSAGAANVFYAVGEHAALGFSPFGIDAGLREAEGFPNAETAAKGRAELTASYKLLGEAMPQVLAAQASGQIHGFLLDPAHPSYSFTMKDVTVHVSLDEIFGHRAQSGYGLVLREGPDSFLGIGKGFRVSFTPSEASAPRIGLATVDEGAFVSGEWVAGRRLNGDEDDQGAYWRFDQREAKIERATIYRMK